MLLLMLRKSARAEMPTYSRPIAHCDWLANDSRFFGFRAPGRHPGPQQREEQRGFRADHRWGKYLLIASLVTERTVVVKIPLWIISSDFSKDFDRVAREISNSHKDFKGVLST